MAGRGADVATARPLTELNEIGVRRLVRRRGPVQHR
jgi:hypothetical protein